MEDLIPFLVMIAFFLMSLIGKVFQKKSGEADYDVPTETRPSGMDRMLREIMDQAGFPEEEPVASEHRPTPSERQVTASEHRPTASETRPTASEHRRTASEVRPTASEHVVRASEHLPTPGEHLKGDVATPLKIPVARIPTGEKRRRRSPLAAAVSADLRGGARPLARAILLREILGPPVAMRRGDPGTT